MLWYVQLFFILFTSYIPIDIKQEREVIPNDLKILLARDIENEDLDVRSMMSL